MEFATIEAFDFSVDESYIVEEDRNEDLDIQWTPACGDLDDYTLTACINHLGNQTAMVVVSIRDYVTFNDDGEVEDYGACDDPMIYIWNGKKLQTEADYLEMTTV
jgi:hypothetical protein